MSKGIYLDSPIINDHNATCHDYMYRESTGKYYTMLNRWQYEYDQLDEWDKFELDVFWAVKL